MTLSVDVELGTGVRCTPDELACLRRCITLHAGGRGEDIRFTAMIDGEEQQAQEPHAICHLMAMRHGLPETRPYALYGVMPDGEFTLLADAWEAMRQGGWDGPGRARSFHER